MRRAASGHRATKGDGGVVVGDEGSQAIRPGIASWQAIHDGRRDVDAGREGGRGPEYRSARSGFIGQGGGKIGATRGGEPSGNAGAEPRDVANHWLRANEWRSRIRRGANKRMSSAC